MARRDIGDDEVRWTLDRSLWLVTAWMAFAGLLMILTPSSRFADPIYRFIMVLPSGDDWLGGVYVALSVLLGVAMRCDNTRILGPTLFVCGLVNWVYACMVFVGSFTAHTGFGAPFALYVGAHQVLLSVMFTHRSR